MAEAVQSYEKNLNEELQEQIAADQRAGIDIDMRKRDSDSDNEENWSNFSDEES